jgi:hypothetical protein
MNPLRLITRSREIHEFPFICDEMIALLVAGALWHPVPADSRNAAYWLMVGRIDKLINSQRKNINIRIGYKEA